MIMWRQESDGATRPCGMAREQTVSPHGAVGLAEAGTEVLLQHAQ